MARYTGTAGNDVYHMREGVREVLSMLGGDDTVDLFAAAWDGEDRVDAGDGVDTAILVSGGFYNFGHDRFTNFESMVLVNDPRIPDGRFEIYIDDSVGAADGTLSIFADQLRNGRNYDSSLFFDGAPERDASLVFHASKGDDVLIGGFQADTFYGGWGKDLMTGNDGGDSFVFEATVNGDHWGKDRITDFHPGEDHLTFRTDSVTSFDQLLITRTHEGIVVRTPDSGNSVTLLGLLPRDLTASDVTFEPSHAALAGHALSVPHDGPLA